MSTRVVLAPRARVEREGLTDCRLQADAPASAAETLPILHYGLAVLREHPTIGRKVEHDLRELVISLGRTDSVALYDYDAGRDVVIVLAVRHPREGDRRLNLVLVLASAAHPGRAIREKHQRQASLPWFA